MRGTVLRGPREVELCDLPVPRVHGPRDAVIRVTASAICGTDLHPYRGELPGFGVGTVLGHEFAGVVEDAGDEVAHLTGRRVVASDLVACGRCRMCQRGWHYQCPEVTLFGYSTVVGRSIDGGQAEYVTVPFADVVLAECPDELTDEQALFTGDVLATGYTAAERAEIPLGGTVAVIGAGTVGLLAGMCARARGAATVVIADPSAARRTAAEAQGFIAVRPEQLASHGSAQSVIEAVGSDDALRLAVETAAPRGTIVAIGAHHSDAAPLNSGHAFARELTLRFAVGDPIAVWPEVFALVRTGRVDPAAVISHRLPLAEVGRGYELFDRREATKVVLLCSDVAG
ncbi:alcohol dehydrogenase catalytic domain-containing protein [Actinocrispum sp. NPDC049592]|uniref:alcohol dehydrogenase catalytic domain-containing protein n=1 Tax=Actinocrispum sp. NPDC049592 TaxID=3154835 RepID=UPI0034359A3F